MSNSNHYAGHKLSFKAGIASSLSAVLKNMLLCANLILKWIRHILLIIYSFKRKCGLDRLQRAALSKQWGHVRPAGRQFDKPALGGLFQKILWANGLAFGAAILIFFHRVCQGPEKVYSDHFVRENRVLLKLNAFVSSNL